METLRKPREVGSGDKVRGLQKKEKVEGSDTDVCHRSQGPH